MRVWVPGGHGMLGRAVQRLLAGHADVVVTGRDVDLADGARVRAFAGDGRFDAIVSCAAYTAVDKAESDEDQARRDNADGPAHLGAVAKERSIPVVHVSTDYVFPGDARRAYVEDDATGPLGAYGRTKLAGEQRFLAAADGARGYVVRTSWLFGKDGKSFVTTMLKLMAERDALRVVEDQVGRPTGTDDLARALWALVEQQAAPGVYHFANAGQTSWHAFALAIKDGAQKRALPVKASVVEPIPTSAYPTPARRPAWSVLDTAKIEAATGIAPRPWRAPLDEVLDHLANAPRP
jgi:dTDP-4-dehydrorhamnose reductase